MFVSLNGSCVLTLYKNTQICDPEHGHATVKHFTEIVEFKRFVKVTLSHIFLSESGSINMIKVNINKYD